VTARDQYLTPTEARIMADVLLLSADLAEGVAP